MTTDRTVVLRACRGFFRRTERADRRTQALACLIVAYCLARSIVRGRGGRRPLVS